MPNKAKKSDKPEMHVYDLSERKGELKAIGGSMSDDWNNILAVQTLSTLWLAHSKDETRDKQCCAVLAALVGIAPQDEFEGMIAAQLIACHNASMECFRRAALGDQTFEGKQENLNQANRLSRTYSTLLEALNRHRGKGQQKVVVEHVNVHAGGQAVVGTVETPGGGITPKSEEQAHARQIAHAPQPAVWSADKKREPVPVAEHAERPLPNARRTISRRSKG